MLKRLNKNYINKLLKSGILESEEIKKLRTEPTGEKEISKFLGYSVPVIPYHTLTKFNDIYDVFQGHDAVIMLYEQYEPNSGHYCALVRMPGNQILFFDPYGCLKPDTEQLKFNELEQNKELQKNNITILNMLKDSKYDYISNPYEFQSLHYDIGTCGIWCSAIITYIKNGYTLNEFARLFDFDNKKGMRDSAITAIGYGSAIRQQIQN